MPEFIRQQNGMAPALFLQGPIPVPKPTLCETAVVPAQELSREIWIWASQNGFESR
jgi:hypothetical protein